MNRYLVIFFLFFSSSWVAAEDEVVHYDISLKFAFDKSFRANDRKILKKDLFNILVETQRFNFILPVEDQPITSLLFKGSYYQNKTKKNFRVIKMELLAPDGTLVNSVLDEFVIEKNVPLRAQALFLELFMGYKQEIADKTDSKEVPKSLLPQVKAALEKFSKESQAKPLGPAQAKPEEPEAIEEDEVQEEGNESEAKAKDKKKPKKKVKKAKNSPEISNFENSPNLDLTKEYPEPEGAQGIPARWLSGFSFYVGQEAETVITESITDVETTTNRLILGGEGHFGQEDSIGFIGVMGSLGIITGEHEYGFGPKFDASLGYYLTPLEDWVAIGGAIQMNTFNFAGIVERGGGIRKSSHSGMWIGAGLKLNFDKILSGLHLSAHMFQGFTTTATVGDEIEIPTSASKLSIQARVNILWGMGLNIRMESVTAQSTSNRNFNISDDSLVISLAL